MAEQRTTNNTSVITRARRIYLTKITSGAISEMPMVTQIAFGDGGVDEAGEPIQPNELQTSLNNEIGRYDIDEVTYPVETTARYTVTIPEGDLIGKKISEMALVDSGGGLCAIKTMYVKQKDEGVKFTFEFDDEF